MNFKLSDIKQYIGNRCGLTQASDITNYSDSILNYFLQAMTTTISSGEFSASEIPELTAEFTETVTWSNGQAKIYMSSLTDVLHVDRIAWADTVSPYHVFRKLTPEQLDIAKTNQFLLPTVGEGLYTIDANLIRILVNIAETKKDLVVLGIRTPTINEADVEDWITEKFYGKAFLMRSIELASQFLRRELGLEV